MIHQGKEEPIKTRFFFDNLLKTFVENSYVNVR